MRDDLSFENTSYECMVCGTEFFKVKGRRIKHEYCFMCPVCKYLVCKEHVEGDN